MKCGKLRVDSVTNLEVLTIQAYGHIHINNVQFSWKLSPILYRIIHQTSKMSGDGIEGSWSTSHALVLAERRYPTDVGFM